MIDTVLLNLSNSKLFSGCIMLLTNIGGKYLVLDMPTNMEKIFSKFFVLRLLVLFSIFFMATRDVKISILLTLLFFIVVRYFINEKSTFCVVSNDTLDKKISQDEYNNAKKVIEKYYQESNKNA
jgi:fatty-acid desaturase